MQKLQLKPYYIIGLQNMALPFTLLLIETQNMLIKIWPTFVHLWVLDILHEPLILLGQMALVEVQNRNLGTHLRMFLHNTPEDWAFQVHMYAYAHNSQPISELNVSPYEIVFHTRPRIPLTIYLNFNRDSSKTCISQYCSQLPEHSHYDKTDFNPFFYKTLSKPIPQWFLAVETAMLQIYSTVYYHTLKKLNSHAYITKTYHEGKPLPIGTFVLKRHFAHVHFSDKLKPLRIGPYKILDRLSDVTYELLSQDGSTLHVHRNHLIPYYPKKHSYILTFVVSCVSLIQLILTFRNP